MKDTLKEEERLVEDEAAEEYRPEDLARVCSYCGKVIIPGKSFCPNCGRPADPDPEKQPMRMDFLAARRSRIRKIVGAVFGSVAGVLVLSAAIFLTVSIRNKKLSDADKAVVERAYARYLADELTYDEAVETIGPYVSSSYEAVAADAEKLLAQAEEIRDSREEYSLGYTYMIRKDYYNAVKYFSAVSKNDTDRYDRSVGYLKRCKRLYRSQAVLEYEKALGRSDIDSAKEILAHLVDIFPEEDFGKRISDLENEQLQEKIKDAEYWQEVESSRAVTYESGYYLSSRAGKVYVHNYNDASVTTLHLDVALFDSDGMPLKDVNGEHIIETMFEDIEIPPGETVALTLNVPLPDDCAMIKACVDRVRYSTGQQWSNPFLAYWLDYRTNSYSAE